MNKKVKINYPKVLAWDDKKEDAVKTYLIYKDIVNLRYICLSGDEADRYENMGRFKIGIFCFRSFRNIEYLKNQTSEQLRIEEQEKEIKELKAKQIKGVFLDDDGVLNVTEEA